MKIQFEWLNFSLIPFYYKLNEKYVELIPYKIKFNWMIIFFLSFPSTTNWMTTFFFNSIFVYILKISIKRVDNQWYLAKINTKSTCYYPAKLHIKYKMIVSK